jgi:hypothetical protein
MGMSTHAVGYRPADDRWKEMKAAWDACIKARIEPPDQVIDFFDGEYPGDRPGQEVDLGDSVREFSDFSKNGYEIDVRSLPPDVYWIRVYNAW